ncbi:Tetratricopeptide repeat-containing protein [Giardia muris]|uniref:Tetratricopeptide repeat-containing protein n=1 Tax=Giardia muris TaxID=5742 RepID=A0A4Z1STD4_GIAMU|nr:Tetratricopeptide repeat-containing protein [Giardia muris]|eukprot:TNJ29186.1 Tetratricopeptide repeat-containing protein [Giardia muris]
MSISPIYRAYLALRRGEYNEAAARLDDYLTENPSSQTALLLRLQCVNEFSYVSEVELDEVSAEHMQKRLERQGVQTAQSFSRGSAIGVVRPASSAIGKPLLHVGSRLTSMTRSRTGRISSRMTTGTTRRRFSSLTHTKEDKPGDGLTLQTSNISLHRGSLSEILQQLPARYLACSPYARLAITYLLRSVPSLLDRLNLGSEREGDPLMPDPGAAPYQALSILAEYGKQRGKDFFYHTRLGRANFLIGQYYAAANNFRMSFALLPRLSTQLRLVTALAAYGQLEVALTTLEDCAGRYQTSPAPYLSIGRISELLGEHVRAINAYSTVLARDPGSLEALAALGALILNSCYSKSGIRSNGLKGKSSMSIGSSLGETEARLVYERVLQYRPDDPTVWCNIGLCHVRAGEYGQGCMYLATALMRCNEQRRCGSLRLDLQRLNDIHSSIWSNLGLVFIHLSEYATAKKCFSLAIYINKNNADAQVNLGTLAALSGDGDIALWYFNQALNLVPDHQEALYNRAILHYRNHRLGLALEDAERCSPYLQNYILTHP